MSDDEEDHTCPLCEEEMDLSDKNFIPCPCGYRVCMWCWHHIKENLNGLCPACRTPYNSDPHAFAAVDRQEIVKKNRERKLKEKQEKKSTDRPAPGNIKPNTVIVDRKHLHNYRVVQRNLLYVIGLPAAATTEEILRKAEFFGQYGKISKVVVHKTLGAPHASISAYVTFTYKEDAKAAIQALDSFWIDGHPLRASFGTTKYCNNFIRNVPCTNPECVYLHELGEDDDRFTKEEIQAGYTKLSPTPGKDQIIVTGCGGPSGTGKRPAGETILPPPVFLQDIAPNGLKTLKATQSASQEEMHSLTQQVQTLDCQNQNGDVPSNNEELYKNSPKVVTSEVFADQIDDDGRNFFEEKGDECDNTIADAGDDMDRCMDDQDIDIFSCQTFNGMTMNMVFPVPVSSLVITVWSGILKSTNSNLESNPFGHSNYLFSDLLDLTLPPVDSISISSYYKLQNTLSKEPNSLDLNRPNNQRDSINVTKPVSTANPSFTALKQLFPGVNLNYGSAPTNSLAANTGSRF